MSKKQRLITFNLRLILFIACIRAPFFQACGYLLFVALVAGCVKLFILYRIRQVLLLHEMPFVIVSVFISLAVTDVLHHGCDRVTQVKRYRVVRAFLISSCTARYAV